MQRLAVPVRLKQQPLVRAICQLRYPQELGFNATLVRPLQKELAAEYPYASAEQIISAVSITADGKPAQVSIKDVFRFQAKGEGTSVQVSDDFIALETTSYDHFSSFAARWRHVALAAVRIFDLGDQVRLGLRYTNAIERPEISTVDEWQGLIADQLLAGLLMVGGTLGGASSASEQVMLTKLDVGMCAFRHGFPRISTVVEQLPHGYILDIDSFDESMQKIDVDAQLDVMATWNHQAVRLLRSAVTDELWESFAPEVPE